MVVKLLDNNKILIPKRAEDNNLIGDGFEVIDETHPEYKTYLHWLQSEKTQHQNRVLMSINPQQVLRDCVREANGDLMSAILAADYIFSAVPNRQDTAQPISAPAPSPSIALATDIHSTTARRILTQSLKAIKSLTKAAKKDLSSALEIEDDGSALIEFVDKYRLQLAKVLTTTQLASILEGMREVASTIPSLTSFPGTTPLPATLEPKEAKRLINKIAKLKGAARDAALYNLPKDQQNYIEQAISASEEKLKEPKAENPSPKFVVSQPDKKGPENIHIPVIDNAVRELSAKNILTKEVYENLSTEVQRKAFTIASAEANNFQDKVGKIQRGVDHASYKETVLDAVDEGTFLSEAHQETLFRTNVQAAYSDGQAVMLANPIMRDGFPYVTYDAIHDDRVRDNHLALEKHGIDGSNIYRLDDPVFQAFRPPWDYNDRCGWTPLTVRQAAEHGVHEAKLWLESGVEPYPHAHVPWPPFSPPEGFQRTLNTMPLSIQLSLQPGISLAVWRTLGGRPNPETGEEHVGGYRVLIDEHGTIIKGRARGQKVKNIGRHFDRMRDQNGRPKTAAGVKGTGNLGSRGSANVGRAQGPGQPMAGKAARSGYDGNGAEWEDPNQPTGDETTGNFGPDGATDAIDPDTAAEAAAAARLDKVNRRIEKYSNHFASKGNKQAAEFMDMLWEHINEVGVEQALATLGEERVSPDTGQVQYKGTGYFEDNPETEFIKRYLGRAGILLQTGDTPDPSMKTVRSAPIMEEDEGKYKQGDVVPTWTNIYDKLQESKLLPGLESTEDISTLMGGQPVTHFTPEVIDKLDETYGKGKWIVKSYGDEAYAGFGIFFPQRVKQIQEDAKSTLWDVSKKLKRQGFSLARDENGNAIGVTDTKSGNTYRFNSKEFNSIPNQKVKTLGKVASTAAPNEHGTAFPLGSEESLEQNYGIKMRWSDQVKEDGTRDAVGITDWNGRDINFNTPEWEQFKAEDETGAVVDKIDRTASWGGVKGEVKFMAQPAFEAIGVSEADRAAGMTWETSREGRVHVVVKDGKASVVPYATLARREDTMPAVFADDDIKAMEKAAQEAIDALPESERTGQVYAPDVMKTKDGWRVVELNSSVATGSSAWLEQNPLVIDAYVSHLAGRDPSHVKFIRNLLGERMRGSGGKVSSRVNPNRPQYQPPKPPIQQAAPQPPLPQGVGNTPQKPGINPQPALSTEFNERDHPRKAKGQEGAGQFVEKSKKRDQVGKVYTIKHGKLQVKYSLHKNKSIRGPKIKLQNYKQQDVHSCGFVAALTISRYFDPDTSAMDVLKAVRPSINHGVNRFNLIESLDTLGIDTDYRTDLTIKDLRRYVEKGIPVIVSVWPDEWISDHWTIVQGFDDEEGYVYLTNHKRLPLKLFKKQWSDMDMRSEGGSSEGIVCFPYGEDEDTFDSASLSIDDTGREHRGKGKGGGQFVSKGKGSSSTSNEPSKDGTKKKSKTPSVPQVSTPPETTPENTNTEDPKLDKYDPEKPIDERVLGKVAPQEEYAKVIAKALEKAASVPTPTEQEKKEAEEGVSKLGANKYRRNLVGNTNDRKKRREKLLREFGDGEVCPCLYCGAYIGDNLAGSLEQDKIVTTVQGGRYRLPNLVPCCADCNKVRGDMDFKEAMEKVVKKP